MHSNTLLYPSGFTADLALGILRYLAGEMMVTKAFQILSDQILSLERKSLYQGHIVRRRSFTCIAKLSSMFCSQTVLTSSPPMCSEQKRRRD